MRLKNIFTKLVNVNDIVIENAYINPYKDGEIIFRIRPIKRKQRLDPTTGKKAPKYDNGYGLSRWRSLDLGVFRVQFEYAASRVRCSDGKVREELVPWAAPGSRFTYDFEKLATFLAKSTDRTAASSFMGISWNTVGPIVDRYMKRNGKEESERFRNLRSIGVDETSYKNGHKYITTVVDHDTHKVIWCHKGHGKTIFEKFLLELTEEQRNSIRSVSGDGARWIDQCAAEYLPNADRCVDPYHVVTWAMDALDDVRTEAWGDAKKEEPKEKRCPGRPPKNAPKKTDKATEIKGTKYALGKNPENLTENQKAKLEFVAMSDKRLYRAYLLKEKLRLIFQQKDYETVRTDLNDWLSWAQRCRIPRFRELREKIKRHFNNIVATIKHGLSNARIEALNNKIKLSIRMAYGFRNEDNMLALIMLRCSDFEVSKPERIP